MVMMVVLAVVFLKKMPGPVNDQKDDNVGKHFEKHVDDDKASQTSADDFDGLVFAHWELAVK